MKMMHDEEMMTILLRRSTDPAMAFEIAIKLALAFILPPDKPPDDAKPGGAPPAP